MSFLYDRESNTVKPDYTGMQIQTSAEGLCIPVVFGRERVSGNLLWYGDFISHKQTQSTGKGGSGETVTGYKYYASFIMGLCEGGGITIPDMEYSNPTPPETTLITWQDVATDGEGTWVAVGYGSTPKVIYSDDDGLTWHNATLPTGFTTNHTPRAVCHYGNLWVMGSSGTYAGIFTSPDGIVWTYRDSIGAVYALRHNGVEWVALVATNYAFTSPDGIVWTSHSVARGAIVSQANFVFNSYTGELIAFTTGAAHVSDPHDGSTWTMHSGIYSGEPGGAAWSLATGYCIATIPIQVSNEPNSVDDGWTASSISDLTYAFAYMAYYQNMLALAHTTGKLYRYDGTAWYEFLDVDTTHGWVAMACGPEASPTIIALADSGTYNRILRIVPV